ncbi:PAS domain S-box protein [Massilia sp. TWR1-2-2]|uniref:hybrid sensor histidine kinase/response regulator n=1 Tax=Massilia sp. TWR1-2-2 TaxID=2804584 RepID=UPI003CEFC36A
MSESASRPAWTEAERLTALRSYAILDTEPERAFDDIVRLAGQLLEAPIVAVNLIDADRQWFKSEIGLGTRELPLDDSICKFVLLESARMVVCDTREDTRFSCNPLVTGAPGLRFYAGELLKSAEGLPLGTLCVLDTAPRPQGLNPHQAFALRTLARQVQTQLELRKIVLEQDKILLEQMRLHAELMDAQQRSRLATEAAGLGLWSWDPAGDVVVWENERSFEIFGLTRGDAPINGQQFMRQFLQPDAVSAFAQALAATLSTAVPFQFQCSIRRPDGELRWIDFFGKAQVPRDGAAPLIVGVVGDITARKLAEVELQDSRQRFENIVSQAATGVVQTDPEGRINVVNDKFCAMLGYARAELLTMNVLDITASDSRDATAAALAAVGGGDAGVVVQKQYRRSDGSLMWASSGVSAVRGASGQFQGIVAIVVDISKDRLAEERLRKLASDLSASDQRKSEFLATLAHELRNPLAPISTGLSVLKLGGDNAAAVTKIRGMMERQVAQMVRLIDDLLDVARISGGKIDLQKRVVDIKTVLAAAIETSLPFIEHGAHQLVVRQPDEPLWLHADPTRISQVLSNLLNNAAKYTPLGGRIEVQVQRVGADVAVSIADNGVGIPAESLSSIFLMFNQVRRNMNRAQGGLGVGLSLVKRLVELHGGQVEALSVGKGAGSTFTVRLPLAQEHGGTQGEGAVIERTMRGRLRVLVADDNVDAAQSLAAMFELQGHATRVAHSGVQAIEMARGFMPEVAFLDIGMPEMNGYETARAMRSLAGMEGVVLVALTGWGNESDRALSKDAGFDHHLTKPADGATIDRLLDEVARSIAA